MEVRTATFEDVPKIQELEKEYYDGFCCPEETLKSWIGNSFLIAEENEKLLAFLLFEFIDEIKALPFIHERISTKGDYIYISEVGSKDFSLKFLQPLFDKMLEIAKEQACKAVIWLTGEKAKHDKFELSFLKKNGFEKFKRVENWEAYPGKFVSDHSIWIKKL